MTSRRHFVKVMGAVTVLAALPAPMREAWPSLKRPPVVEADVWDDYTKRWLPARVTGWDEKTGEIIAAFTATASTYATRVRVRAGPLLIESKYHGINLVAGDTLELTVQTRDVEQPLHRLTTYP